MKCTRSKIIAKLLKVVNVKNIGTGRKKKIFENPKYNSPPSIITKKYNVVIAKTSGRNLYTVSSEKTSKMHIVFLHGGAYRYPSTFFHWVLVDKLLKELDCKITFVDYPLAPEHKCKDNVRVVMEAYGLLFKKDSDENVVLMGDSAGGGLALVMAQIIKEKSITPKPKKIVLLSPWLDISMETPIPKDLQECDFMLDRDALKENAIEYAGDLDLKNPLCSPYYGDSSDVGEMALFIGTRDILYIDALRFNKKAKDKNYNLTFYKYKDMQHDWVLFPMNDTANAIKEIINFIER